MICGLALAQDAPRGEIFGGYSYLNVDYQSGVASSSPIPRQSANGWEVSPSFNVNHWFAVEGDVAGYYKNNVPTFFGNADLHDYSFTAGPRFNYRAGSSNAFVHALVGGDNGGVKRRAKMPTVHLVKRKQARRLPTGSARKKQHSPKKGTASKNSKWRPVQNSRCRLRRGSVMSPRR
jgi:hypothetical protein